MLVKVLQILPLNCGCRILNTSFSRCCSDVVINSEDYGTLRGIVATALKKNDEVVEPLYDRILGRTSVHDIYMPESDNLIVAAGELISEDIAKQIEDVNRRG